MPSSLTSVRRQTQFMMRAYRPDKRVGVTFTEWIPKSNDMPQCCVVNCTNTSGKDKIVDGQPISYHRLPSMNDASKRVQRKEWLGKINRKNRQPTANAVVCSIHFRDEDFEVDLMAQMLKTEARRILRKGK